MDPVFRGGAFSEFDDDFGILLAIVVFPLEFLCIVLEDIDILELDDHGKSGNFLMHVIGDPEGVIEVVEGAHQIEVLVSHFAEQAISEDSDCLSLDAVVAVGLVDFDSFFHFHSVGDHWSSLLVCEYPLSFPYDIC